MKYLIISMLVLGCSTAKPKPKAKPTEAHLKRCLEIIEKHSDGESLEERITFCKCAINITTDENPDLNTKIEILNKCMK